MSDQELMQRIHDEAGAAIAEVSHLSNVPPAFLAALIANETGQQFAAGGMAAAAKGRRFEPGVLADLWSVIFARKPAYGSLHAADLLNYITKVDLSQIPVFGLMPTVVNIAHRLDGLASSRGLTQIMGYHILEKWFQATPMFSSSDFLEQPDMNFRVAVKLLTQFADRFQLDLASDFAQMFTCWNTGSPDGKTFDANYVPNGLARMKLYGSV